jgi:hypothetical protein
MLSGRGRRLVGDGRPGQGPPGEILGQEPRDARSNGAVLIPTGYYDGGMAGLYCQPTGYEGLNLLVHVEDLECDAVGIFEGE